MKRLPGKKTVGNAIFLLLVFSLTVYGVFHGEDPGKLWDTIGSADIRWLLAGVAAVLLFIWGEAVILHYLMKILGIALASWKCFLISSVGFFFSCITPSASGGQPMQMVYLKKEHVPLSVSTLVLMVVTITYKMVLVLIGIFLPVFQPGFVHAYLEEILPLYWIGLFLNVACVGVLLLLVFHPVLMRDLLCRGYGFLVRKKS